MGLHSKYPVVLACVLLLPALCLSQFTPSRTKFDSNGPGGGGSPTGACGFDDYGSTANSGRVAAVSDALRRGGAGCGACYKVMCTNTQLCSTDGVTIAATNTFNESGIDFVMSLNGSLGLGVNPAAAEQLRRMGTVDVQYRRVACTFDGSTVKIKINKNSRVPDNYLAIAVIYVPGSNDVVALQISNNNGGTWIPLERPFGGVFHLPSAPRGPFKVRVQFRGSQTWLESPNNVIPADWNVGAIYDTGIQGLNHLLLQFE